MEIKKKGKPNLDSFRSNVLKEKNIKKEKWNEKSE
jgi:hypothetical protein